MNRINLNSLTLTGEAAGVRVLTSLSKSVPEGMMVQLAPIRGRDIPYELG